MLDIITLVSPATNIGSDTEFLRVRSFIYIINTKGLRNEPRFSETWFFHSRDHTWLPIMVNDMYHRLYSVRTALSRYANRCTFYKHTLEVV